MEVKVVVIIRVGRINYFFLHVQTTSGYNEAFVHVHTNATPQNKRKSGEKKKKERGRAREKEKKRKEKKMRRKKEKKKKKKINIKIDEKWQLHTKDVFCTYIDLRNDTCVDCAAHVVWKSSGNVGRETGKQRSMRTCTAKK